MKLIILHEESKTRKEFTKNEIVIGRSEDCDFQIPGTNLYVSKHQGTIIQDEKDVSIRDDGSKNGTIVRGKTLSKDEHAALSDGEEIQLGKNCILKIFIEEEGDKSHKPAPISQKPSEKEAEIKLTSADDSGVDELNDSALGINRTEFSLEDDPALNGGSSKPSPADIEKDLSKIDKTAKKK